MCGRVGQNYIKVPHSKYRLDIFDTRSKSVFLTFLGHLFNYEIKRLRNIKATFSHKKPYMLRRVVEEAICDG